METVYTLALASRELCPSFHVDIVLSNVLFIVGESALSLFKISESLKTNPITCESSSKNYETAIHPNFFFLKKNIYIVGDKIP